MLIFRNATHRLRFSAEERPDAGLCIDPARPAPRHRAYVAIGTARHFSLCTLCSLTALSVAVNLSLLGQSRRSMPTVSCAFTDMGRDVGGESRHHPYDGTMLAQKFEQQ
jgi:hypothetical protein